MNSRFTVPTAATWLALLATTSSAQVNDDCANATVLPNGFQTVAYDGTGATTDGASLAGFCDPGAFGTDQIDNDIWFRWTSDFSGCVYMSTLGLTTVDTRLAIYDSTGCPDDPASVVACVDDEVLPATTPFEAGLDFQAVAGTTYTIRLGTFGTATAQGAGSLLISQGPGADLNSGGNNPGAPGCIPGADDCADAVAIQGAGPSGSPALFPFSTVGATLDLPGESAFNCGTPDTNVWYEWTAPHTGSFFCTTIGLAGGADTLIAVHDGDCSQPLIGLSDDHLTSPSLESQPSFFAVAGQHYWIGIYAAEGVTGQMGIFASGVTFPIEATATLGNKTYRRIAPLNRATAEVVARAMGGHLVSINSQVEQDFVFNNLHPGSGGVWIGATDEVTEGTFLWTNGATLTYSNWKAGEPNNGGNEDSVAMDVGGWNDTFGCFLLPSIIEIGSGMDDCSDAEVIGVGTHFGDLTGATHDGTAPASCASGQDVAPDIWWSYTATRGGQLRVTTCGTHDMGGVDQGVDTVLSLHDGCGGTVLACDDCASTIAECSGLDTGIGRDSIVSIPVVSGQEVLIRVAPWGNGPTGPVQLNVEFTANNDACANAKPIMGTGEFLFNTIGMTKDGADDELCGCGSVFDPDMAADVWYDWLAPSSGVFTVSTVGLAGGSDTVLGVHDGGCGSVSLACNNDAVARESEVHFRAIAGNNYLIRVGANLGSSGTVGSFSISTGATLPTVQQTASFAGKNYALLTPSSWTDAQLAAEEMGWNLATVNNELEHDFIISTFQNPGPSIWIGLNDRAVEGTFEWVDGTPVSYTNFRAGEPTNSSFVGEDFVDMFVPFSGLWNDSEGCAPRSGLVEMGSAYQQSCFGDGGNQVGCTNCPCSNNAPAGTLGGCLNSAGTSASLEATGEASVSLGVGSTTDLRFALSGAPPTAFCILNSGDGVAPGNMANPCFGLATGAQAAQFDGLRCAIMNTRRHGGRAADVSGSVGVTNNPWGGEGGPPVGIANAGSGFAAGQSRFFQVINRDDALLSCMRGLNTSQAIQVTFTP